MSSFPNVKKTTTFYDTCKYGCWQEKHAIPFALLKDAFGGKIRPTDIDGLVERRGYFLYLEWKEEGTEIPEGQRIEIENKSKLLHPRTKLPACTVLVAWHRKNRPSEIKHCQIFVNGQIAEDASSSMDGVFQKCKHWYEWVEEKHKE